MDIGGYPCIRELPSAPTWCLATLNATTDIRSSQIVQENYSTLITQLYDHEDPYLLSDAACAMVNPLVVQFKPRKGDPKAALELDYNFVLAPRKE